MNQLRAGLRHFANVLFFISMAALALSIALFTAEIVARYFFSYSFIWIQEFNTLLICWVVFLGFARVVIEGEDISIRFLVDKLKPRTMRGINLLNALLLLGTSVLMEYKTILLLQLQWHKESLIMGYPSPLFTLPLAITLAAVFVHACLETVEHTRKFVNGWKGETSPIQPVTAEERGEAN